MLVFYALQNYYFFAEKPRKRNKKLCGGTKIPHWWSHRALPRYFYSNGSRFQSIWFMIPFHMLWKSIPVVQTYISDSHVFIGAVSFCVTMPLRNKVFQQNFF